MKWTLAVAVGCALMVCAFVRAQEKADAKPDSSRAVKITQPWNKLTSLTDEQKDKIKSIHGKALDEMNEIKKKETADIMAVLTDEQKAELKAIKEKDTTDKKMKKSEGAESAKKDEASKDAGEKKESETKSQ